MESTASYKNDRLILSSGALRRKIFAADIDSILVCRLDDEVHHGDEQRAPVLGDPHGRARVAVVEHGAGDRGLDDISLLEQHGVAEQGVSHPRQRLFDDLLGGRFGEVVAIVAVGGPVRLGVLGPLFLRSSGKSFGSSCPSTDAGVSVTLTGPLAACSGRE